MERLLVIIYGAPLTSKTAVAERLAHAFPVKTALLRHDDLFRRWIIVHDPDLAAEHTMVYTQVKLLVSHYLRNHYHVVVEGTYLTVRDGTVQSHEEEIDQLQALTRAMHVRFLTVYLYAAPEVLRRRAATCPAEDAGIILHMAASYRPRSGPGHLEFDTGTMGPDQVVASLVSVLNRG